MNRGSAFVDRLLRRVIDAVRARLQAGRVSRPSAALRIAALVLVLVSLLPFWLRAIQPTQASGGSSSTVIAPNGDGTTTAWNEVGCTATTFYACIYDSPAAADDNATYIEGPNHT